MGLSSLTRRALVLMAVAAAACASVPEKRRVATAAPELRIELFADEGPLGYEYDVLLARVDHVKVSRLVLDEDDIERYVVGPAPSPVVAFHLTATASVRWKQAIPPGAEDPFVVSVAGKRLYAGLVYPLEGAAALQFPVLHAVEREQRMILYVTGRQGTGATDPDPQFAKRIDRTEVRRLFERQQMLEEDTVAPRALRE